MITGIN